MWESRGRRGEWDFPERRAILVDLGQKSAFPTRGAGRRHRGARGGGMCACIGGMRVQEQAQACVQFHSPGVVELYTCLPPNMLLLLHACMRVAPWFLPGACRGVRRGRIPTPGGAEASCVTRTPLGYAAGRAIGGRLSGGVRTGIFSVHTDRPKRAGAGAGVVVWKLRVPPGARTMRSATLSLPAGARRTPKAAGHLGQPSVGVRLSPGEPGAQSADCF